MRPIEIWSVSVSFVTADLRRGGSDWVGIKENYFAFAGQRFILLHAFLKKTQKTPRKGIPTANPSLHFLRRVASALDAEVEIRFRPLEAADSEQRV